MKGLLFFTAMSSVLFLTSSKDSKNSNLKAEFWKERLQVKNENPLSLSSQKTVTEHSVSDHNREGRHKKRKFCS